MWMSVFWIIFPQEVTFSYFQAKASCPSCNLKFFSLMTGMFPGWGHFVALIMHLLSHLGQDFRCVVQINVPNVYFWFGLLFALNLACLQPFWLSTANVAEQLQRLIYLEGWQGLCRPSVISFCYLWNYPNSLTPCLSCSQIFETSLLLPLNSVVHQGLCLTRSGYSNASGQQEAPGMAKKTGS